MLDTLLSRLKEEIAIDGTKGSSIDTVWKYAELVSKEIAKQSDLSIQPTIDASYKAFIWNYLKQEAELEFYEDTVESASLYTQIDDATLEQDIIDAQAHEAHEDKNQTHDEPPSESAPIEDEVNITEDPKPYTDFMDYIHGATEQETEPRQCSSRKRKTTSTKKAAASKKKLKPAKKPKKKKEDVSGHSDSDFELGSGESESESNSDVTECPSEDYSEHEDNGEAELETKKYTGERKPVHKMSNPVHVQRQPEIDNSGLKAIENVADLSYEQAYEQYGPRLRILASARLQHEQLFVGIPSEACIPPSLFAVLRAIIKTRTQGLYQASITRLLNFDPRSTGHYVKSLEEKGAITRRGVSINYMRTNICIHARFSLDSQTVDMNTVGEKEHENEVPYNVNASGRAFSSKDLLFAMVDLANVAPDGMVLARDILHGLGFNSTKRGVRKWFNRSIDEVCSKGYFEKGSISLNGGRLNRCLRLLKLPEEYVQRESDQTSHVHSDEITFPIKIKNTKDCDIPIHHLLCDAPLDYQCYEVVAAGGIHGATQKDVSIALNMDEMRILFKVLDKLVNVKEGQGFEQYGVVRYLEFEGRLKRYRYFTLAASIKINENIDYVPPPLPVVEVDESKFYERDIFTELPHKWKDFRSYRKLMKNAEGNRNVAYPKSSKKPWVPKIRYNPDGTPREKSKYLLNKERKMQALRAQECGSSSDNPHDATLPVHSFFTKPRDKRGPKNPKEPLPPPSSDPVPGPILTGTIVKCPATAANTTVRKKRERAPKPDPPTSDEAAPKKRKYTRKTALVPNDPELDAGRVTRSGRCISLTSDSAAAAGSKEASDTEMTPCESTSEITQQPILETNTNATKTHTILANPRVVVKVLPSKRIKARSIADFFARGRKIAPAQTNDATASASNAENEPKNTTNIETDPAVAQPDNGAVPEESEDQPENDATATQPDNGTIPEKSKDQPENDATATQPDNSIALEELKDQLENNATAAQPDNGTVPEESEGQPENDATAAQLDNGTLPEKSEDQPENDATATQPDNGAVSEESEGQPENDATATQPDNSIALEELKDQLENNATAAQPDNGTVPEESEGQPKNDATAAQPDNGTLPEKSEHQPKNDATATQPDNSTVPEKSEDQPENDATATQPDNSIALEELKDQLENNATAAQPDNGTVPEESEGQPENDTAAKDYAIQPNTTEEVMIDDKQPSAEVDRPSDENDTDVTLMDYTLEEQPQSQPGAEETSAASSLSLASRYKRQHDHVNRRKTVNSYMEARIKMLYEYLEEVKIIEMGKIFTIEFSKRAAMQYKGTKNLIDAKTLWNTALELERRGQAQTTIVECQGFNGKFQQRKVIFHHDMDPNSAEFQDFVTYIKERRSLSHLRCLPKLPKVFKQPVIRLAEHVENMQQEAKALGLSGQTKKAKQLELRISELSKNLETFGRDSSARHQTYWMIEAIQFGWISARMIRAKIFHKFLHQLLESNVEGVNQKERTITLAAICNNMTFHLVCQVIGIFKPTPLIAQYSQDGSFAQTKLSEIPDNLKQEIYDENTKFLRRLRFLINPLEYCKIVTAQYTEIKNETSFQIVKYAHLAPSYKLEEKIPITDWTKADEPLLREHLIRDLDDLSNFWMDLKYVATFHNIEGADLPVPADPYEKDLQKSIHSMRNWSTRSVFTRGQRVLLNGRVDKVNRTTPLNSQAEMKSLAAMMRVPFETIRCYYEKVENALERRDLYNRNRKLQRLLLGASRKKTAKNTKFNNYNGRRVISADSGHAFGYRNANEAAAKKHSKGYMDDMQDIPVVQDNSYIEPAFRKLKRNFWTKQEDDVLLYVYTILKHRAKNNDNKFWWAPIDRCFPEKTAQACRSRIGKLMSRPVFREKYESYLILWDSFFKEGLANGDIKDESPDENMQVDVLAYVAYFVKRLQLLDAHPVELALPSSIAKAHEQFQFIYNESSQTLFEDTFHESPTLLQKLHTLYQTSLTTRTYTDSFYDQPESSISAENHPKARLCSIIRMYALMTLMTPAEFYDPFYGFHVLSQFPVPLKEAVFEEMRADKTLILVNGDRPIPGSKLTLSAKFLRDMRGQLPANILVQAKEYEKFLSTQTEKFKFSPIYVSSGMMACLLNSLSSDQISISLSNFSTLMKRVLYAGFKLRGIDKALVNFDLDIQKVTQETGQTMTSAPMSKEVSIKMLDPKEYDDEISRYIDSQDENEGRLIQSVMDALYAQGETGLTLYQLKVHLNGSCSDQDITRIIHKLRYNDPALVCRVGFNSVRYVHVKFASIWTVNNRNQELPKYTPENSENIIKHSNGKFQADLVRKDIVIPSLWVDMNGHVTELVLNGCKEAIVDLVLRKPGISEADIYRHMSKGLSKREVRDLLDMLVEQQALRQIQVQSFLLESERRSSIFSNRKILKCTRNNSIEKNTQSCFWITTGTYSSM
ncbi:hypothetical protein BD408DRAFT_419851 [Parasitella parasitica]|nr:hypothetical protein BD408DRAFT_419851 [Parasitella parasitica]